MLTIKEIARVAHETNRTYCETLGDNSQPFWEDAPQWQKDSAIEGVRAIKEGNVNEPKESHINWLRVKENEGWVYGEEKNPEKKTHPCILPFDNLPEEQQMKDFLFFDVVSNLLGYHG